MVFGIYKFFKEIVQEGLAQAEAETAAERAALQAKAQVLAEKYAELSAEEIFLSALSAPYREIFMPDLSDSAEQKRPAYWLSAMDVPDDKKADVAQYLDRDFGVSDGSTLRHQTAFMKAMCFFFIVKDRLDESQLVRIFELIEDEGENVPTEVLEREADQLASAVRSRALAPLLPDELSHMVLWLTRLAYIYTVGAGLGYIDKADAVAQLRPLVGLVGHMVKSWENYGHLFVEGEKLDGTNNLLARKLISRQVTRLLAEANSPWLKYPWADCLDAQASVSP